MSDRVLREKEAYNKGDVYYNSNRLRSVFQHVFHCQNTLYLKEFFEKTFAKKIPNSVVLDYGCLYGNLCETIVKYRPLKIVGIDISDVAIENAKLRFGKHADYFVMDAHKTDFDANSFDCIIGQAILHHLDWTVAIKEVNRILKPGGYAMFFEPLGDNPIAKLLRMATPKARTKDEFPISREQILYANSIIGIPHHEFANLVSVPLAMMTSQFSDNPENILLKAGHVIDLIISKTPLKYWMRIVALVWEKSIIIHPSNSK